MASLALTLGALEIGILVSTVLYGIATLQTFLYTEGGFKDPLWLRLMVGIVWVLETTHTLFIWYLLYTLTVTKYGVLTTIDEVNWSLASGFPFASVLGSIVQGYFAHRVRVLSGSLIVPIVAWCGALLRTGFGITVAVAPFTTGTKTVSEFLARYEWIVIVPLSINLFVDVITTSTSCFYLLRQRSDFGPTQRVVDKLVMYTVETGLLTSLCAIAILSCVLVFRENLVAFSLFTIYPKLFSNCFLTALNTRRSLRKKCSKALSTGFPSQTASDV